MKKIDLAYMAGLFDGEGSIYITGQKKNKFHRTYALAVSLMMANPYLPKLFHFAFGGSVCEISSKRRNTQTCWLWRACANRARDFLIIIQPYLRLKKAEAELAITFQNAKQTDAPEGYRRTPKTEEALAVEEAQRILLHELKIKSKE